MPALKIELIRKCKMCGNSFQAKTLDSWYCSPACSKRASKHKAIEIKRQQRLDEVVRNMDESKDMITVPEAYAMFGISKETLYRLIRKGGITFVNAGIRQILVSKEELLKLYPLRKNALEKSKPIPKLYRLEPEDCYTIGEISKKYKLDDSTVWAHIRKYSIPSRQIGNYVYVPKREIDELYKDIKL